MQSERRIGDIEYALQEDMIKSDVGFRDGEATAVGVGRSAALIRCEMNLDHISLLAATTLCQKQRSRTPKASVKARRGRPEWQAGSKRQQEFHQMCRLMAKNEVTGNASQRPELMASWQ